VDGPAGPYREGANCRWAGLLVTCPSYAPSSPPAPMPPLFGPLDDQRHWGHLLVLRKTSLSTKRRLTSAEAKPSKRGAHGGRLCRWCAGEVFPPHRTYCGPNCVHEWRLRSDTAYLRSQVFLRDKGFCACCHLDTLALRRRLYDLPLEERERVGMEKGFPAHQSRHLALWEADHMVPVSQGGGVDVGESSGGVDSFQTLCVPCHIRKSSSERKTRPVTSGT
jgi:5-methylcytosine-specific restriction endonuclease McrA